MTKQLMQQIVLMLFQNKNQLLKTEKTSTSTARRSQTSVSRYSKLTEIIIEENDDEEINLTGNRIWN